MLLALFLASMAAPVQVGLGLSAEGTAASDRANDRVLKSGTLSGTAGAETSVERIALKASYTPTIRFAEETGTSGFLFHTGTVSAGTREGRWSVALVGSGALGEQDFSPISSTPAPVTPSGTVGSPPINRLPDQRFIRVAAGTAQITADYLVSSRTSWSANVGVATAGGLGDEGARLLPRQLGAAAGFNLRWQADHLDWLTASVGAALSRATLVDNPSPGVSSTERTESATGDVSWLHRFSPYTQGALGAGVAATANSGAQRAEEVFVVPTFNGSLAHSVPLRAQSLSLSLQLTMQPQRDPLTGVAYVNGSSNGSVNYSPKPWLALAFIASGSRVIGGDLDGQWGAVGEISAAFRVGSQTQIRMGFREAVTPAGASAGAASRDAGHVVQWSAFTGISTGVREAF